MLVQQFSQESEAVMVGGNRAFSPKVSEDFGAGSGDGQGEFGASMEGFPEHITTARRGSMRLMTLNRYGISFIFTSYFLLL